MKLPMHEVIVEKVAEGMSDSIPELIPRDLSLGETLTPTRGNVVKLVAGVRRCGKTYRRCQEGGKTYRLYQEVRSLISQGVPRGRLLYFNFDDEPLS